MSSRADSRAFRFQGGRPPEAGLIQIDKGVISFIISQRIGLIIVVAFAKLLTCCHPYPAAESDLR